jgi:hypothetical protein
LVPILAKDEEKQKAIREKAIADALATQGRGAPGNAGPSGISSVAKAPNSSDSTAKPTAKPAAPPDGAAKKVKTSMFIQAIPPFNKDRVRKPGAPGSGTTTAATDGSSQPIAGPSVQATPASPTAAQVASRLNANASVFKPNANAPVFKPVSAFRMFMPLD